MLCERQQALPTNMTCRCVAELITAGPKQNWTKIEYALVNGSTAGSARRDFWHDIAYANLVQEKGRVLGRKRARGLPVHRCARGRQRSSEVLEWLESDLVAVIDDLVRQEVPLNL
jgi:hypothetical protein